MAPVNWKRIFLSAFAFFVVYAVLVPLCWIVFLRQMWQPIATQMGWLTPQRWDYALMFAVLAYVSGMVATWFYAGMRDVYGPGPKTAFFTAIAYCLAAGVLPTLAIMPLLRLPVTETLVTGFAGWVVVTLSILAAAWAYQEKPAPRARAAAA